jgi:hypothetical protein
MGMIVPYDKQPWSVNMNSREKLLLTEKEAAELLRMSAHFFATTSHCFKFCRNTHLFWSDLQFGIGELILKVGLIVS